jgi:hypothetical protein
LADVEVVLVAGLISDFTEKRGRCCLDCGSSKGGIDYHHMSRHDGLQGVDQARISARWGVSVVLR